jgi:DNA repair protein RecN (Recombination protein N)
VSGDPEQVSALRTRLDAVNTLERKYGVPADELPDLLQRKRQRLDWLTDAGQSPEELEAGLVKLKEEVLAAGKELTSLRAAAAKRLTGAALDILRQLEFAEVELLVDAVPLEEPGSAGLETVEFLVTLNPGEPARPLALVASGGEASRLMLGLKAALSDKLDYLTVFLDEIEAGLGGKAAESLAAVLYQMSRSRQVVAVSHLPLVAARGDRHLLVTKAVGDDSAAAGIEELQGQRRKEELARMLGDEGGAEEHALVERLLKAGSCSA